MADPSEKSAHISTLNEKALHASLKTWYAEPNDRIEVHVDGYLVDIVRDDLLIEIQTRNFSSLKRKLNRLTETHPVRLVLPLATEKWILRLDTDGETPIGRRKSPKRGRIEHVFEELVSLPNLVGRDTFSLEVLLIQEEETRWRDGTTRAWRRRGWVTKERRLLDVVMRREFHTPRDFAALLPVELPDPFTTADIAQASSMTRRLAQQMAYCLREMNAITPVGKQGNSILYARAQW
ncbi:MAG: hypothetical protein GY851_23520 [bacterium]|nr:hypothetical protein [bacterium]